MKYQIEIERVPKEGLEYGNWNPFAVYVTSGANNHCKGFHADTLTEAMEQASRYIMALERKGK